MWKLLLGGKRTFLLLKKIEFSGIEQEKGEWLYFNE